MTMGWIYLFGAVLTGVAAMTSAGMLFFPERWSRLEARAYGGAQRPWQVWALATVLLLLWVLALIAFFRLPAEVRSWAGWALVAGVPALWAVKAAALVFNPRGRAVVSSIDDPRSWQRIGLARLPIAVILAGLTWLA